MKQPRIQIVPPQPSFDAVLADAMKHYRSGMTAEAETLFRRCLQLKPDDPTALRGLAAILFAGGKREQSIRLLERAIDGAPDNPEAWHNLGSAHASLRHFDEAVMAFRRAIELNPAQADLYYDLGRVLRAAGREEEALPMLALAAGAAPQEARYERALGDCLRTLNRPREAASAYRRAIELDPGQAEAAIALGSLYRQEGQPTRALGIYKRLLGTHPTLASAWFNMGAVLFDLDRLEEAADAYRSAYAIDNTLSEAQRYLANVLQKLGRNDEARAAFAVAAAIDPESPTVVADAWYRARLDCDWATSVKLAPASDRDVRTALAAGRGPAMSAHAALVAYDDPALHRAIAKAQSLPIAQRVPAEFLGRPRRPVTKDGPLRIGYLSGDIGEHPVSHLIRGLFRAHDRRAVTVHLYSFGPDDGSEYRREIRESVDAFVDVTGLNDNDAASRIDADGIDILIDLNGQTGSARMGIPARRPAPIQAIWLGYPGTGGADWNDYIVADDFVAPPADAGFYVEQLCLLPHSYLVTDGRQAIAPGRVTRADMALPETGFVFASFNNSYKIDPPLFDVWMRILRAVDGSVFWLPEFDESIRTRLQAEAIARGVEATRLVFARKLPKEWHLKRIGLADLALDTLAYNGHTTTADALWGGLPVLTVTGRSFARRVSGSLLRAIGAPELIVPSLEAYEQTAIGLARDPIRLAELRHRIAANRATAPLFDTDRFARNLERAYDAMRRRSLTGGPAAPIQVREDGADE
jgi:protein O-GlcNAc transferase